MAPAPSDAADKAFDPYHKWLGIPAHEQPPHHYRLLGLEIFESDADVIDAAANRQMSYVKQCAIGPHRAHSQRILSELSAARVCLLNPDRKEAYDTDLREHLAPVETEPALTGFEPAATPQFELGEGAGVKALRRRRSKDGSALGLIAAVVLGGFSAGGLFWVYWTYIRAPDLPVAAEAAPEVEEVIVRRGGGPMRSQTTEPLARREQDPGQRVLPRRLNSGRAKPPLQPGQVDLLDRLNPSTAAVEGEWGLLNRQLITPSTPEAVCQLGSAPRGDYTLEVDVERQVGNDYFALGLVVGQQQFVVKIDAQGERVSGVEGWQKGPATRNPSTHSGRQLGPDKVHTIRCRVTADELDVVCGETTVITLRDGFPEDLSELTLPWNQVQDGYLFVGSNSTRFRISRMILTPLSESSRPPNPKAMTTAIQKLGETPAEPEGPVKEDEAGSALTRAPIPPPAERREAERDIKREFREAFQAKTAVQKRNLITDLLASAETAEIPPLKRYVLLDLARETAESIDDADSALQAIDKLNEAFAVSALTLKYDSLAAVARGLGVPDANRQLAERIPKLVDEAVAADDLSTAYKLSLLAVSTAKRSGSAALILESDNRHKLVQSLKREFDQIAEVREKLAAEPEDATANQKLGEYLCFVKQEWDTGLPHLAKSTLPKLKALAEQEAAKPATPEAQRDLGDAWWDGAKSFKGSGKEAALYRARYWYQLALPTLTATAKSQVSARIEQVNEQELRKFKDQPAQVDVANTDSSPMREGYWSGVPTDLQNSRVYEYWTEGHPTGIQGGVVHFRIRRSGIVYLAATWEQDGADGPWQAEVTTPQQLQAAGWRPVAQVGRYSTAYAVYMKFCVTGELYSIRTRKYGAPLVIVRQ